jgi:hypothetical protein
VVALESTFPVHRRNDDAIRYRPPINPVVVRAWMRLGLDTVDIAKKLNVTEADIWNAKARVGA